MEQTPDDEVLRAISHDILEPLRTIRWYAARFERNEVVSKDKIGRDKSARLDQVIEKTQNAFIAFYDSYKIDKDIGFYRDYAEQSLQVDVDHIRTAFYDVLPYLKGVIFQSSRISVEECRKIVNRLEQRYHGLLDYLDARDGFKSSKINLSKEAMRVWDDLTAARDVYKILDEDFKIEGYILDWFDQTLIGLLIQNLIINSFKYQSEHRHPKISLRMWTVDKSPLQPWLPEPIATKLRQDVTTDRIHLIIYQDNGVGIPSAYHERVFEAYFKVPETESPEGSGIGLAIVRTVVLRHSGAVWLESAPQLGTRFFVALPASTEHPSHLSLSKLRNVLASPLS